jgi:hypothetical protein
MPVVHPLIAPLVYAVPVQLLAYHVACVKGTDVDQPRNLAKSVDGGIEGADCRGGGAEKEGRCLDAAARIRGKRGGLAVGVDPARPPFGSPRFAFALGRSQSQIEGKPLLEMIAGPGWDGGPVPASLHDLAERLKRRESFSNLLVQVSINLARSAGGSFRARPMRMSRAASPASAALVRM